MPKRNRPEPDYTIHIAAWNAQGYDCTSGNTWNLLADNMYRLAKQFENRSKNIFLGLMVESGRPPKDNKSYAEQEAGDYCFGGSSQYPHLKANYKWYGWNNTGLDDNLRCSLAFFEYYLPESRSFSFKSEKHEYTSCKNFRPYLEIASTTFELKIYLVHLKAGMSSYNIPLLQDIISRHVEAYKNCPFIIVGDININILGLKVSHISNLQKELIPNNHNQIFDKFPLLIQRTSTVTQHSKKSCAELDWGISWQLEDCHCFIMAGLSTWYKQHNLPTLLSTGSSDHAIIGYTIDIY